MATRKKNTVLLSLVLAGEAIFFLPFVLVRVFRPTILAVFEISNFELGTCFSAYGLVAMASYIFGGPLADRFPSRNLIALALWLTACGGLYMATIPDPKMLKVLYGFWGFTTIFLFWAALIRSTREWGAENFQGRAFGLLEGGRGLTAALIGSASLFIFSSLIPNKISNTAANAHTESLQSVILIASCIVFLSGFIVWFVLPKKTVESNDGSVQDLIEEMARLIKKPEIWLQAIIIICAYVGYKTTDDLSLYANEVLGFDEVESAGVGTTALWLRPLFAVFAGLLVDRFDGSKIINWCFSLIIIGGALLFLGWFNGFSWLVFIVMTTTLIGVYGLRGIYFTLIQESGISLSSTGAAVGIMSLVGYTPDVFMSPLMGFLLDNYPGALGHQYVFLVLGVFAAVGLWASIRLRKLVRII